MLLLRAFYDKFAKQKDSNSDKIRQRIEACIWKTDAIGNINKELLKIDSEVATDNDKDEFISLLKSGVSEGKGNSQYAQNYRFFEKKVDDFINDYPSYAPYLPARILNNCILLPIEAESQDTALRIFSTLNDRGLPLSDADIFKAQFYKFYGGQGRKDEFIEKWKILEEITSSIFKPSTGTPMDELFTRYMYFLRAKAGNKKTTTEALRKFFEQNKYQYLQRDETMTELLSLANFWKDITNQNRDRFSDDVLKRLFVLNYAPNGMWQNITSVYFLSNKDLDENLDDTAFFEFLDIITTFIFAFAITNPGVNALRTPIYDEMVNIVKGGETNFQNHKNYFEKDKMRSNFENYVFNNHRSTTRAMITWYAFSFKNQPLLDLKDVFHLEHIYPSARQKAQGELKNEANLDSLGNKVLLESAINIRASDYRFEDKKKIYTGQSRIGNYKAPTQITEIMDRLVKMDAFEEANIIARKSKILDAFFSKLASKNLI